MANAHQAHAADKYYVPHSSPWPFFGAIAAFTLVAGAALTFEKTNAGSPPSSTRTRRASTTCTWTARSAWG